MNILKAFTVASLILILSSCSALDYCKDIVERFEDKSSVFDNVTVTAEYKRSSLGMGDKCFTSISVTDFIGHKSTLKSARYIDEVHRH